MFFTPILEVYWLIPIILIHIVFSTWLINFLTQKDPIGIIPLFSKLFTLFLLYHNAFKDCLDYLNLQLNLLGSHKVYRFALLHGLIQISYTLALLSLYYTFHDLVYVAL